MEKKNPIPRPVSVAFGYHPFDESSHFPANTPKQIGPATKNPTCPAYPRYSHPVDFTLFTIAGFCVNTRSDSVLFLNSTNKNPIEIFFLLAHVL